MSDDEDEITPLSDNPRYVVEINETKVYTYSGSKPGLWMQMRERPGIVPRLTVAEVGVLGDLVHIWFEKRSEAEDFRDFLIRTCVHKSAIKAKRGPKGGRP